MKSESLESLEALVITMYKKESAARKRVNDKVNNLRKLVAEMAYNAPAEKKPRRRWWKGFDRSSLWVKPVE